MRETHAYLNLLRVLSGGLAHLLVALLSGLLGSLLFGLPPGGSLLLCLAHSLALGGLLGCLLLLDLEDGLALGLNVVLVALDDGTGDAADLVDLGNVDGLGCVFAFVVEPVLNKD